MKHAMKHYNRIQDPGLTNPDLLDGHSPIAEDEPVFLLRARDVLAPGTVRYWASSLEGVRGNQARIQLARDWALEMEKWQQVNGFRLPGGDVEGPDATA
jgi:hypothetical protein